MLGALSARCIGILVPNPYLAAFKAARALLTTRASTSAGVGGCLRATISTRFFFTARSKVTSTSPKGYNRQMETLLEVIALLSSGLFAGAALYITAVEHPAGMSQGALLALQGFRPRYKRAAPLQASLAVICFLCSVVIWRLTGRWAWLAGGALVGAVAPFTFAFMMSTNRLLLDAASPPKSEEALRLLAKWARLHAVRTCLSLLGFIVLLVRSIQG